MKEDDKPTFRRVEVGAQKPRDLDPMAEFSLHYHFEAERRRSRLERKWGAGYWDEVEQQADDGLLRHEGGFQFFGED